MRLTLVTDTYQPSINGVVRTLEQTIRVLGDLGHAVTLLQPGLFRTLGLPGYPDVRLAFDPWRVGRMIADSRPDSLHIAVEGPLGMAAKLWADRHDVAYTTSYHTRFPEYLEANYGCGLRLGYRMLRWFHRKSAAVMANTPTMQAHLAAQGFDHLSLWGRGVDTDLFTPHGPDEPYLHALLGPVLLNVGRVSAEKNLLAFYELDMPGWIKVQVGDGPLLETYRARYPDVLFLGAKQGDALAACYRAADVFVFPSKSDTYGLVMLEAMASGVPVAAFPVPGPQDVVTDGLDGALNDDLCQAITKASACNKVAVRTSAVQKSWKTCTEQFVANLVPIAKSG